MTDSTVQPADTPDASTVNTSCFVVGMPRAATTWMCKCLNEHSHAACFGESMFFGRGHLEPETADGYSAEQLEQLKSILGEGGCLKSVIGEGPGCLRAIDLDMWPDAIAATIDELSAPVPIPTMWNCVAGTIARLEGKQWGIDKTPHHLNWIDRILASIPDAKFVVMVREPYGFTLSYKHIGDARGDEVSRRFRQRYHPFGCAVVWKGCMIAALNAKTRHPDRVHLVAFDDVRQSPDNVLRGVQEFFGLPVESLADRVPPDNTSHVSGPKAELRPDDVFWINRVAGAAMKRGGYVKQRTDLAPGPIIWSMLRLPVWGFRNLMSLRRIVRGSLLTYLWRWIRPR